MGNRLKEKSKSGNWWIVFGIVMSFLVAVSGYSLYKEYVASLPPEDVELVQFNPDGSEVNVVMETNYGTIEMVLFPEQAPNAVENFVTLAEEGYYDGLTFHRVINDFMIQGGDPNGDGTGGAASPVVDEDGNGKFDDEISDQLYHFRGAICYANSGPNTNGSQFYIVQAGPETLEAAGYTVDSLVEMGYPQNVAEKYMEVGGTPSLDGGYTVFGMVTSGMEVVDEIAAVETTTTDGSDETPATDMPVEPVVIESVTVVE